MRQSGLNVRQLALRLVCATLAWLTTAGTNVAPLFAKTPLAYPTTKRVAQVDNYHGVAVEDPFRWLEDDVRESDEVAEWVRLQNELTFGYLENIPARARIKARLTELWDYEKYSAPFKKGGRYFYFKNDGLQNQSVLYTADALDAKPRLLLDPNTWSEDGTVSLSGVSVSDDGTQLAYGVTDAGSDWQTWRVLEVATGKLRNDELKWVKFSSAAWTADSRGFFYSRYDEPQEGQQFQSLNLNQKVYYHEVGTQQADDVLVYERPDHPEWGFSSTVSEDGRYLILTVWKGTDDKYLVLYRDLRQPYALPQAIIGEFENEYAFVGNDGPVFFFKTDQDAPRGRLIAIDTRQPKRENWRELIPQAKETLTSVGLVGNLFIAEYLRDAYTQVKLFAPDGELVRKIELPGIGTAGGFSGRRSDTETFYTFTSFATPPTIYRYNLLTGESRMFRQAAVKFNPDEYEVKQVFFDSHDGVRIPMFLAYRKGLKLDGSNPTLLYGYGGFNISLTPAFSISRLAWMEMGGLFAMPNLRGGGEYGEEWHEAGKLTQKQNVFFDFQAAAEWLIENKYTRPEKLAIQGRSNGGLLVGACLTQRPDLYGACLPGVGVMDMLRFHQFTAGRFWVDEYGSAEDPKIFPALQKYSPYHNLHPGIKYPATLITTADTDDRVVPGHSFKFAAAAQEAQGGAAPILIRIETRAGHGAGKPTTKQIEEVTDEMAFLVQNLQMDFAEK